MKFWGFSHPFILFWMPHSWYNFQWRSASSPPAAVRLTQKSMQKKSRLRPPRTKKLRLAANKSELAPRSVRRFEQQIFLNAACACFSAHRPMPFLKNLFNIGGIRQQADKFLNPPRGGQVSPLAGQVPSGGGQVSFILYPFPFIIMLFLWNKIR